MDAVAGASLAVPAGRVTGLIGPNGAGKTTMFNACFGLVRTHSGTVHIGGREVSRKRPGARARAGLGRTFQDLRLFESLTVRDNVALGREGGLAGSNPLPSPSSPPDASPDSMPPLTRPPRRPSSCAS